MIEFGKHAERVRKQRGEGKPETFTFLGFTHYCGKRRSDGSFIVWRKTAQKRMVAKLRVIKAELIRRRHAPPAQVGEWLTRVVQGCYQYHAVPGNLNRLSAFRHRLCRLWRGILNRRSQRGERPWQRLVALLENAGFRSLEFCSHIRSNASPLDIRGRSRMRQRARTDLCGGRSAMVVPTATSNGLRFSCPQFS